MSIAEMMLIAEICNVPPSLRLCGHRHRVCECVCVHAYMWASLAFLSGVLRRRTGRECAGVGFGIRPDAGLAPDMDGWPGCRFGSQ